LVKSQDWAAYMSGRNLVLEKKENFELPTEIADELEILMELHPDRARSLVFRGFFEKESHPMPEIFVWTRYDKIITQQD